MTKILEKTVEEECFELHQLVSAGDSFSYILTAGSQAIVIDPCDEELISTALKKLKLDVKLILITHASSDHVKGLKALKEEHSCQVMASSRSDLTELDQDVQDEEEYCIGPFSFQTICTSGYTNDHTCYHFESLGLLFTGDTLYLAGCGRINEKNAPEFLESFNAISALAPETIILCGHDYLKRNLLFAEYIEGSFSELQEFSKHHTNFANLKLVKKVNPFLRLDTKSIRKKVQEDKNIDVLNALIALRADYSEG
jgi:hydroxyacylglutathione hydrolase